MSEPMPEPPPEGGGGGNFLTQKHFGLPGIVWIAGAALLAYFLFFRKSGGAAGPSSSGGGGTADTGTINLYTGGPGQSSAPITTDSGSSAADTSNNGLNPGQGSQSGIFNPQPTPSPNAMSVTTATSVAHPATGAAQKFTYYTVKKGDTLASIAAKFGISVATLAHANVYVAGEVPGNAKVGQTLGTGAGLKTGQVLKVPLSNSSLFSRDATARLTPL